MGDVVEGAQAVAFAGVVVFAIALEDDAFLFGGVAFSFDLACGLCAAVGRLLWVDAVSALEGAIAILGAEVGAFAVFVGGEDAAFVLVGAAGFVEAHAGVQAWVVRCAATAGLHRAKSTK